MIQNQLYRTSVDQPHQQLVLRSSLHLPRYHHALKHAHHFGHWLRGYNHLFGSVMQNSFEFDNFRRQLNYSDFIIASS